MNEKKLGQEPAFASFQGEMHNTQTGMSKRFYAACAAMHGLLSQHTKTEDSNLDHIEPVYQGAYNSLTPDYYELIRDAYNIADELLKQENQP